MSHPEPTRFEDALTGAVLGLALGDALGFVVEAAPSEVAGEYARDVLRAGRAGARHHPHFPFGQYSDDTQLARELLASIVDAGGWSPGRFGARLAALVLAGADVGAGPGTRGAANRLLLGAPWTHAATPAPYAGNGSAMRVAPIGVLYDGQESRWRECALEQSRVTHGDPRCAAAAVVVAGAARLAGRPGRLEPGAFLDQLAGWAEAEDAGMARAVCGLGAWQALSPAAAAARLHASGLCAAPTGAWRGVSPYVVPSVLWSLYAFLRSPDDWWEAVCTAVEIGGDTDTMAAMTGAIAGARNGPSALPGALLAALTDRGRWGAEALARLALRCAAVARRPLDTVEPGVIVAESTRS
ncbi:MAG TPA: ADP-ribosylglycohydrolase family protein [Gemmatimonadales bacterium]